MARTRTWRRLVLLLAIAVFAAIVYRWISLERLLHLGPELAATPTPEPSPTRPPVISGKIDTGKLFSGITTHSTLDTPPGADAATERADPDSYVIDLKLQARLPSPNKTIEELAKVSPQLPMLMPGLAAMLSPDPVSPLFAELYGQKVKALRERLSRLDLDADRMPTGTGAPTNFKPFTSYRWAKKTPSPNPYLAATEERLRHAEDESALPATIPDRKRELRTAITELRSEIFTLKKFSFLIGATDPYIVIPSAFARGHDAAKVGDYALVIFGDAIYPALVGDIGPNDRVGEASLRIAKEINAAATPYNRPVSDLKVSYLIFPGTAETPFEPPDLNKIQSHCQKLVDEIGGATVPLHHWENIIPPSPTPTPSSSPSVSPTPTAVASETSTSSSEASPSATFAYPIASPTP